MQRRRFLGISATLATIGASSTMLVACAQGSKQKEGMGSLNQPADHWHEYLTDDQFSILFHENTERAFSSDLNNEKRNGTFVCAACNNPLFNASTKYDSGTGWPSFWQPLDDSIGTKRDFKLVLPRTEYHCSRCGGHQGHIFEDGPEPTGKRYCNNGLALHFVAADKELPKLRS
jgi:peptide-methionine (R)-S-oxide reductase